MQASLRRLYGHLENLIYSRHAHLMLACIFYLDAVLFFPVEPVLVLFCLERRDKALYYASLATFASVLGGITSYCIGSFLWHTCGHQIMHNSIVSYLMTPQTFAHLCNLYKTHQWSALLIAGLPPIPFKAATLTAGFCQLSLIPFIICVCIVRGVRYFGCALVVSLWGKQVKEYIDRYLSHLVLFGVFLLLGIIWWYR